MKIGKKMFTFGSAAIIGAYFSAQNVHAAEEGLDRLSDFAQSVGTFIQTLIPIFFALILLAFFWGLVQFLFALATGKEDAKERGKSVIIGGVVALFVGASVFALVLFLQEIFGFEEGVRISIPFVDVEDRVGGTNESTLE
jgi:hypothetical protein